MTKFKLALCSLSIPLILNAQQQERPNIVLFMVDDMGWQDTSLPFWTEKTPLNERYHTPNMERLARLGVKFTQAYACSISSPTRCSLLTGCNQARHRVTNWTLDYNTMTDEHNGELIMPEWNVNGIQPIEGIERSFASTSFVQILKDNGYHTIHCGKAHFGSIGTPGADPLTMGFDVNIAGHAGGGPADYYGMHRFGHDAKGNPTGKFAIPGLEEYWDKDIFLSEALTRKAIKALDEHKNKKNPFFLYMSHYAVHAPIQADHRFYQKYKDRGLSDTEAAYCTLVEGMDKSLGDLMDYLEKTKQMDNTIIIFMSDNGGLSVLGRTAPLHVQNAPLRSGKGSAYEGGIREPMIVYWKGVAKPNTINDKYLMIEDFFPSILEMAQIKKYKTIQPVDGISFIPLITGEGDPSVNRALYWNTPNTWVGGDYRNQGVGQTCAIRKNDYKLVYWYLDGKKELYNIKEDISEQHDLAEEMPQLVTELSKELGEYLRSVKAQRPTYKDSGKPTLWPDEQQEISISNKLGKVREDNIFRDSTYFNWCNSIIKGDDGKYHLIYSRWKRDYKFCAWLTHSTIAHAVSDSPCGPFKYVNTLVDFEKKKYKAGDMITAHNPKIKCFNGKYYLYFISTRLDRKISNKELIQTASTGYSHPNWAPLRVNQRTFVASANSLDDEFVINPSPLVEPAGPIQTLAVNPAITRGHDGRYYLIVKGDKPGSTTYERNQAIAISDLPDKGFVIQPKPVIDEWDSEDMSLWYDEDTKLYYSVFHAHTYIGMMVSKNGIDWEKARDFRISKKRILKADGTVVNPDRMERPYVYLEGGKLKCLSVAVKKGEDTYIVCVPIN